MTTRATPKVDEPSLERYLACIVAQTQSAGGMTIKLDTGDVLDSSDTWGFPKYPSQTVILPPDADLLLALRGFITRHYTALCQPDCWLGTWIHPQTGEYYLDMTTSCSSLEEARQLAYELSEQEGRKIIALYNPKRRQTVYL
jgi:hypothetical protein